MQGMERSKEILTEIQEIAPRLGQSGPARNPYSLPAGFFENFTEILMLRIQMEASGGPETVKKWMKSPQPGKLQAFPRCLLVFSINQHTGFPKDILSP